MTCLITNNNNLYALILMYDLTSAKIVIVYDFIVSLNFVNILKLGQLILFRQVCYDNFIN